MLIHNSTVATTSFTLTYKDLSLSILSLIDKDRIEKINRNKTIVGSIIKIIITCSRQNIPLRGHRDETIDDIRKIINIIDSHSGSNFIAFLKLKMEEYVTLSQEIESLQFEVERLQGVKN